MSDLQDRIEKRMIAAEERYKLAAEQIQNDPDALQMGLLYELMEAKADYHVLSRILKRLELVDTIGIDSVIHDLDEKYNRAVRYSTRTGTSDENNLLQRKITAAWTRQWVSEHGGYRIQILKSHGEH